ncbi:MAG: HEAT repeat domain-containing protein, partial [Anaerolineaceae bacterium]|nr:HEAT repeat domain-containing protein [Anaerolineaceae bacterium]
MISKELAQERLRSFFDPDGPARQLARLRRLTGNLSALGQLLIHAGPEWEKLQKERNLNLDFSRRPLERLEKLSAKDRRALFEVLFPGPAPFVEGAWNLFDRLPYQAGHARRPFRNPKGRSVQARLSWLQQLAHFIQGYEKQDVTWLAAWAPHLGYFGPDALGYLFAAAIEQGGKTGGEVFDILVSSLHGTHETGMMGRHVVRGLLCSSRTDGWEIIERILLAAQREEGLRQVILESIDESHPQAFRRMLQMVAEQNLVRFSAAVRALSVWFGLPFEAVNPKAAGKILENVLRYLDSPGECAGAIQSGDAQEAYYALWALAFDDVHSALPHALKLSRSPAVEGRFVAIHLLSQMGLKEGLSELLHALDDEDLRIPARALASLTRWDFDADLLSESDLFERLEKLLARLKHKQNALKPLVWEWLPLSLDRETTAGRLIDCLGTRSHKRLIPYLSIMNPNDRYRVARLLYGSKQKDEETLQTLLKLAGDASPSVREQALKALEGIALKDADVLMLEGLLARQAGDLRRGVIQLLLGLTDAKLLESAQRLIHHKGERQRLAALELLREGRQKNRGGRHLRALALGYRQRGDLSEAETRLLDEILSESVEEYSLEDALGLIDPQNRTQPVPVKSGLLGGVFSRMKLGSAAAVACLVSLDALVERHRNDEIEIQRGQARGVELLGNIRWGWMFYTNMPAGGRDYSAYPLKELSESWWQSRSGDLLDQDGFELLRALISAFQFFPAWTDFSRPANKALIREFQKQYDIPHDFQLNYLETVRSMVEWLIWAHPAAGETDWLLDALEESVGRIPNSELTQLDVTYGNRKIRALHHNRLACLDIARWQRDLRPEAWKNEHHARLWKIVRWLDEPKPGLTGGYATLDDALLAHQAGAATRDDLIHMFLGPPGQSRYAYAFSLLGQFTWRKLHPQLQAQVDRFPEIREIVEACRERILDVECRRGELPTAASAPAGSIRSVPGIRNLLRLLAALGDAGFERGYIHGSSRSGVFSHLIRNSYPLESDTVEDFVGQVQARHISEKRLIELAVYAPQWADYVQRAVEWEHLSDAVWWLYAHTKDRQWVVDPEIRAEWAARIAEFTPLTADDLMDGAVDVSWFHRVYKEMGDPRWRQLYQAALYTSGGIGHTRARLFSDAMLGRVAAEQVLERITKKRHQDSVRALGLIPLPPQKDSKREILHRYEVMQEFLRTGRKFGSQRKASEKLAVSIGMQNLARTAGYADPQRLEWSMEIEAVADLSTGVIRLDLDDLQFTLAVNELGEPYLETRRNDRLIKTIPAAVRKTAAVAA